MYQPAPAYRGSEPYVFICYSHEDRALVYPQISWLQQQGINIWYDEGISPGEEWTEELGQAISNADRLIFFITPRSVASRHCRDEVHFAKNHQTPILAVHLEDTVLPAGIELAVGSSQAILAHNLAAKDWHRRLIDVLSVGAPRSETAAKPEGPKSPTLRYLLIAGAIVLFIAFLAIYQRISAPSPGSEGLDLSISMAPVRVVGDSAELPVVAERLTEALARLLTQYPEIRFRSTPVNEESPPANANFRLVGSVQESDDKMRFTVRLARTADEESVWSQVFRIQHAPSDAEVDNIATTVGRFLRLEMAQNEQCEIIKQRSNSSEAAQLVCFALAEGNGLFQGGVTDPKIIVNAAERALELDDSIAEAYGIIMGDTGWSLLLGELSPEEVSRKAREAAAEGLRLQPNHPVLLWELARVQIMDLEFNAAEATTLKALKANPVSPYARLLHENLARIALFRNDITSALDHYRRAIRLFDGDVRVYVGYANTLRFAGQHDESIQAAEAVLDLTDEGIFRMGAIQGLVDTYISLGQAEKAKETQNLVAETDKAQLPAAYAVVLANSGSRSAASRIWSNIEQSGVRIPEYYGFYYHLGLGDIDEAFRWLQKAIDQRSEFLLEYLGVDPRFEPLRQDQRWQDVIAHFQDAKGGL